MPALPVGQTTQKFRKDAKRSSKHDSENKSVSLQRKQRFGTPQNYVNYKWTFYYYLDFGSGPGHSSWYSDTLLRAGRSRGRIPVGGEIFRIRPDRPWVPPRLLYSGYRVIPLGQAAGV